MDFIKEFEKEVEKRTKKIRNEKLRVEKKYNELKQKYDHLEKSMDSAVPEKIKSMFNIDNIEYLFNQFNSNFSERELQAQFDNDLPKWFYYLIKYWDHKDDILGIYDYFGIEYNKNVVNLVMPQEWDKETCLLYIDNIQNHYIVNGQIYNNNLGFWYRELVGVNFKSESLITKNYSETPWQFVLRNELFLNDKDVFKKMLGLFKKKNFNSHSNYFLNIFEYQPIDNKKVKLMIKTISKHINEWAKIRDFIETYINKIDISEKDIDLIELALKNNKTPTKSDCKAIHLYYIKNNVTSFTDKIKLVEFSNKFDLAEKAALIKEFVEEKYGDDIIAKELLKGET